MAVITTAVAAIAGVGLALKSGSDARKFAGEQSAYNAEIAATNAAYRLEIMDYNNSEYVKDVAHYNSLIDWQKTEAVKAFDYIADSKTTIETDALRELGDNLVKQIETEMVALFDTQQVDQQALGETGGQRVIAAASGTSGNTARLLEGDIQRQAGVARTSIERNFKSARAQTVREATAIRARRNAQLGQLPRALPSFQPLSAPRPPAPVSPTNPAAPVSRPSSLAVGLGAVSTGVNLGLSAYNLSTGLAGS